MQINKRIKIFSGIILVVIIAISTVVFYPRHKEGNVIRIGYQPYSFSHSNVFQAIKHLKFLEKRGYQPQYVSFMGGPMLNEAFIAGNLDIGFSGDMPTISLLASGAKAKIIAAGHKGFRSAVVVDSEKKSDIKTINDLIGRKVAFTKGASQHYLFFKILRENGIDPKSVNCINMKIADEFPALIANQVDAAVPYEPWISQKIEGDGLGAVLAEGGVDGFYYATEDFINKNPKAVQAFVDAVQEGLEYAQKNFSETSKWSAEETNGNYDFVNKSDFQPEKMDGIMKLGENIRPTEKQIEELKTKAEFLLGEGLIKNNPDFSQKIDFSFVNKTLKIK